MNKITIKEYPQNFWGVASIFKNGQKIADVNKFYDVSADWILIYSTVGGTGTGWRKCDIERKIYIGDCELERVVADN